MTLDFLKLALRSGHPYSVYLARTIFSEWERGRLFSLSLIGFLLLEGAALFFTQQFLIHFSVIFWIFFFIMAKRVFLFPYQKENEIRLFSGRTVTLRDWLFLILSMEQVKSKRDLSDKAKLVWNKFIRIPDLTWKDFLEAEQFRNLSVEECWAKEIRQFSLPERIVFEKARQIRGLRIGVDVDGTIVPNNLSKTVDGRYKLFAGVKAFPFLKRAFLRPGIKPFLIGLLFHNHVELDTTANEGHITGRLAKHVPFIDKLLKSGIVLKDGDQIAKLAEEKLTFSERDSSYFINEVLLTRGELEDFYLHRGAIKLTKSLGLDVLIEDHPRLGPFLERLYEGSSRVVRVRRYRLIWKPFPLSVRAYLRYRASDRWPQTMGERIITTEAQYEEAVLEMLPLIDQLKELRPIIAISDASLVDQAV